MKKTGLRLLAGTILLLVLAIGAGWLILRASLPQLDGNIVVSGLTAAASIERDASGIPLIRANNREDLAFATGFAHAQDRFFQMDTIRRRAAGELSAIIGTATIEFDKRNRFHRFRSRAESVLRAASDADRNMLQRYTDGVNAGLQSLRAKPFEYFFLGSEPAPWRAEDSILAVYAMFIQLNDSRADREVRRGLAHKVLPQEVYDWMYPDGSPWDAPLTGEAREAVAVPSADIFSIRNSLDRAVAANEVGPEPVPGSNNWAVSGALTENGRALVSNDMHLGHSTPNIYYRARFVVEGATPLDVSGLTLPGTPFVVAGSNSHMAWGYTNSQGDYTDAVLLRPGAEQGSYQTPDGDLPFQEFTEVIDVKGADAVEYLIRETVWGPVIDDIDYPDGEVVVSWIAHKPDAVNLQILHLETAASVFEALDIANTMGMPPQNFVSGDADGNIGWTIAGKIPLKNDFNAMLPADWSVEAGWRGWVQGGDYPRIVNPESGRIWTANTRVVDGDALRILGDGGYALGARAKQIRDGLFAKDIFAPADMLAIQYDDRALFLSPWRDLLLGVLSDDAVGDNEQLIEYRRLVEEWIPRAVPDSVGYRLVRAFRLEVGSRVFFALTQPLREAYGDEARTRRSRQFEAPLWSLMLERPSHMLPTEYANWDEFLLAAVNQNIEYLEGNYDGPLSARTWGEINTAAINHPLGASIPIFGSQLNMPADQLNGDVNLPKAQRQSFGASERFSVSPGDEANGLLHMPAGASGHPLSDYYDFGHAEWVQGLASPFLPGPAKHTLTLTP